MDQSDRECECDKSCNVWEYLDYKNCKCRKRLVDKLVEEYKGNIDGIKLIHNNTLNVYKNVRGSCTIYIVLLGVFFIISITISCDFLYFYWYLKKINSSITNNNDNTETVLF